MRTAQSAASNCVIGPAPDSPASTADQLALAAARQAERDAGLDVAKEAERVGAAVATATGGLRSYEDCYNTLARRGADRVSPRSMPLMIPNLGASWVSIELGTRGPLLSECTACAASAMAVGDGLDTIRLGRADVMLCGGAEAVVTRVAIAGFSAMRALSRRNDDPRRADVMLCGGAEAVVTRVAIAGFSAMRALSRRNDDPRRASRPFDAQRDGFVIGEAAAILVLEELEHARARRAKIYAEVAGYGLSADANHVTEPVAHGPVIALKMALADAGVAPDEIDYVNAHATSTPVGDASETEMLKLALGEENARATPISATKGATGHCLGAAGAVEAMFTVLAVRDGRLPPTINQERRDPRCDLDYVPNEMRGADVRVAVSNSFGFGGHNACIVFRRYDGELLAREPRPGGTAARR
jgi:3-oxoacyl-[acyl-carrier-protein] synthase II